MMKGEANSKMRTGGFNKMWTVRAEREAHNNEFNNGDGMIDDEQELILTKKW